MYSWLQKLRVDDHCVVSELGYFIIKEKSLMWVCSINFNLMLKKQNPFSISNLIKLATVSERQAPPIHAWPRLNRGSWCLRPVASLIKLLLWNGVCFFRNCVRKNRTNKSTNLMLRFKNFCLNIAVQTYIYLHQFIIG